MPFDQTNYEADVFSLEGLIAWLETQDPETEYDFTCCNGGCLIGRYLIQTTGKLWDHYGLSWRDFRSCNPDPESNGQHWRLGRVAVRRPHTYGAALERARALRS